MKKKYTNKKNLSLTLGVFALLIVGTVLLLGNASNKQDTRSRASTTNAQTQCSGGTVQIGYSFTNTDPTKTAAVFVYDPQTNTQSQTELRVGPNQTGTATLNFNQISVVSVNNGQLIIDYHWVNPTDPTQNPTAPTPTVDPSQPTDDPTQPTPTIDPTQGGEIIATYNALNCTTVTTTATPSATTVPSVNPTAIPTSIPALPTTPPISIEKKNSTDLNDDGNVNQVDYNLFLREIGTQIGE